MATSSVNVSVDLDVTERKNNNNNNSTLNEVETEKLFAKVERILEEIKYNDRSQDSFKLLSRILQRLVLKMSSVSWLQRLVNIIHGMAVNSPTHEVFTSYAKLCKLCCDTVGPGGKTKKIVKQTKPFKEILISKCINGLCVNKSAELEALRLRLGEMVKNYKGPVEKKQIWIEDRFEEHKMRIDRTATGNFIFAIRLVGFGIVSEELIKTLIEKLLSPLEIDSLKRLSYLLSLSSIQGDKTILAWPVKKDRVIVPRVVIQPYFQGIYDILKKRGLAPSLRVELEKVISKGFLRKWDLKPGNTSKPYHILIPDKASIRQK